LGGGGAAGRSTVFKRARVSCILSVNTKRERTVERKRTWKPTAAGAIDIICSLHIYLTLVGGAFIVALIFLMGDNPLNNMPGITPCLAIVSVYFCASILAMVGGIYALLRQKWALALAGSIGALFCFTLFGILGLVAIVFTFQSRKEFK
jgi:hypothetical protein